MMESYVRNYSERNLKTNHLLQSKQLQRGCKIPSTPSSIPTKYQTVFIAESEKKGFNSRSLRFSYSLNQASKGLFFKVIRTPAPNTYYIQDTLFSKKDFNKSYSSMFHQPITTKVEDAKHMTPSPNQYDASINYCHPNNNVSAHAAFVSRTKRDAIHLTPLKGPSPCHYTVNVSLVKESPKILVSCFKSKTSRDVLNATANNPGPASYEPYSSPDITKKTVFPKKHYLCFSAPAEPVPKTPDVPGPGQYELVDYEGPPKHYFSSAAFVSNTSRWAGDVSGADVPGPGAYHPECSGKQSFLYNNDKKWIPA
ncbi:O(6)-methylguanine-induced apoptosis 2 isoform X2 [Pseudophryne corroboree]|uniref:O(6)-methylguanine-induced apoptosis 2 isoform X2 n=1 Tax=Pseudophryne corroboree TaxID=495146 RepID=UPI003081D205